MTFVATYYSPAVPGDSGFSIDLSGDNRVRLGDLQGLIAECELGAVAISSVVFDDPDGDFGNAGDAVKGLKQFRFTETAAPTGRKRIWTGYTGDRRYSRGTDTEAGSIRTDAARRIDVTLVDLNSFLSFRILGVDDTSAFKRPAESDVVRVLALLDVDFISTTLFDGLVSLTAPVQMDATDYAGQRPVDVLNDCAQQSGKNFFVIYDEPGLYSSSPGSFVLFYDFNDSPVYLTDMQVSNVLSDVNVDADGAAVGPIWPPFMDATLERDPSRVIAGAYIPNGSNSVYRTMPSTGIAFGWRDAVAPSPTLNSAAAMTARADRYLAENAEEDDRITFRVRLPAANVNDWREGEAGKVRFSHLPGYEDFRQVRCLRRQVSQDETSDILYVCEYECTPMKPAPSGAYSFQTLGVAFSGVPVLPKPTTPGNLLLAVLAGGGTTTSFPTEFRFLDDPPITGIPPVPPYSPAQSAAWTKIAVSTTDYSGMNIGGPCGYPTYHHDGGVCTAGGIIGVYYRKVQPGEVTTHPVAVSTPNQHDTVAVWLWELPTNAVPSGVYHEDNGQIPNPMPYELTLGSVAGSAIAIVQWMASAGHSAQPSPLTGTTVVTGEDLNSSLPGTNNPALNVVTDDGYVHIVQLPEGGAAKVRLVLDPMYHMINYSSLVVEIPPGRPLPTIPYPANVTP